MPPRLLQSCIPCLRGNVKVRPDSSQARLRQRHIAATVTRASASTYPIMATNASIKELLDADLRVLSENKQDWANLPLSQKAKLLTEVRDNLLNEANSWAKAAADVKGVANDSQAVAQEQINLLVPTSLWIQKMLVTLSTLEATGGCPKLATRTLPNGQQAMKVWPLTTADSLVFIAPGVQAEVYVQPGKAATQGAGYLGKDRHDGQLAVVLGAGNHGFLGCMDILACMYEHRQVVAFKSHPLQSKVHEYTARAMQPLVERGYLRFCTYIVEPKESALLVMDPRVDGVHMTGGIATHDAIVWGPTKEEQTRRKAANEPLLKVPMTSELGSNTPFLVVAGDTPWTDAELEAQAKNVVIALTNNVSCNCCAAKVLLVPAGWAQRTAFVERLKRWMLKCPMDPPFYPGVEARYNAWKAKYPDAEAVIGPVLPSSRTEADGPRLPCMIQEMDALPADPEHEYALQVESFAPVLNIIPMAADSTPDFITKATAFSNDKIWGTLTCTVIVHPSVEKSFPEEVEKMLQDLKFGTVGVNAWAAWSLLMGSTTWGAFVGNQTSKDTQSGVGVVGNNLLIDNPEKTVYRSPFTGLAVPESLAMKPVTIPSGVISFLLGYLVNGFYGGYRAVRSK